MKSFLAVFACFILTSAHCPADERPNVLLVGVESFRHDHSRISGYHRDTTPNLDELASESARFTRMISASSWTMPAVMSLMTSLHPSFHSVKDTSCALPDSVVTLASAFSNAGYQSAAFVSNPMLSSKFGYNSGFGLYDDFSMNFGPDAQSLLNASGSAPARSFIQGRYSSMITRMGRSWLTSRRDPEIPFFLYLFYFDPHYDYVPPEPYRSMFTDPQYNGSQEGRGITALAGKNLYDADMKHIVALYDGELRYTDEFIGKLLDGLKDAGLFDNTVIVVFGDHGDEFWEHGSVAHGHTLFDELVRVPFFIRFPDKIRPGAVIDRQVAFVDIMPTLLDLAGIPIPSQCLGRSLLPLIRGEDVDEVPAIMETSVHKNDLIAVRTSNRKIILNHGTLSGMYFLEDDPGERSNLINTDRRKEFEDVEKYMKTYLSDLESSGKDAKPRKPDLDPDLIKQLQSLGYMK